MHLNHHAVWLHSGRNYKTPRRVWVYCFLLIHYQIRFVHEQPFPALSAPSCQLANAVAQVQMKASFGLQKSYYEQRFI